MENKKPLIMLGVGILVALLVTLFTYNWLQKRTIALKTLETQDIVVANVDMAWSTIITKEMVKVAPYLKSSLPPGYYVDPAALEGRTLLYPLKANEPITESKLSPVGMKGGGIAAVITDKKRAMAVRVDKVVGVSGFVHPGHRVDVLVTVSKGEGGTTTKIVLENILVLAAGPDVSTAKQDKSAPVDVITLEVTPQEGEKLALAASEGKLQLALRNFSDTEEVLTKGTTVPMLLASYGGSGAASASKGAVKAKAKSSPVKSAPVTTVYRVELIKGGKVTETKIDGR